MSVDLDLTGADHSNLALETDFSGPSYTVGVEEELMLIDRESFGLVNRIEALLAAHPEAEAGEGEVKRELMESVLEIATPPCADIAEAGASLRELRAQVRHTAGEQGLLIGSAATHPFARWEEQRIVAHERYRGLVDALRYVARQELIFGVHVHVGLDDPDKAVHVANGMRVHLPLLLALSANSPFWRGDPTGLASTRTPIFRTFPRNGIPPRYDDFADFCDRVNFMVRSGTIEDYSYLWWDVRPHPRLGTVEVRVMDAQTRVDHTIALAALVQAMVKELAEHFEAGEELSRYPYEMLDENKWLAARYGIEAELVDLPASSRVSVHSLTHRLLERLEPHARELGAGEQLTGVEDILERGTGSQRQLQVFEANHDLRELVEEIVAATAL